MNIKNNKGITLSTVMIAVILLIVIMSSIILSASKANETKKAMLLNNDIEELNRKVNLYYLQNGIVPIDTTNSITKGTKIYYRLIVSTLDNLNLNNKEELDGTGTVLKKGYVINEQTHLIYYVEEIEGILQTIEYKYSENYSEFDSISFAEKEDNQINLGEEEYFIYNNSFDSGEAKIVGLTDAGKELVEKTGKINVPSYYNGYPVTTISNHTFHNNDNLISINMPSIKYIDSNVFYDCKSLENVNMPNVIKIEYQAFYGCSNLGDLNIPNVTHIAENAFKQCDINLKNINMPNVIFIGKQAFYQCSALENVTLPDNNSGLEKIEIGDQAFYQCSKLNDLNFSNVKKIGQEAFYKCTGFRKIKLADIETIGNKAFYLCSTAAINNQTGITDIEISNVTTIGERSFLSVLFFEKCRYFKCKNNRKTSFL